MTAGDDTFFGLFLAEWAYNRVRWVSATGRQRARPNLGSGLEFTPARSLSGIRVSHDCYMYVRLLSMLLHGLAALNNRTAPGRRYVKKYPCVIRLGPLP